MTRLTFTAGEVASLLGLSRSGVYDQVRRGLIPNVGTARKILVPRVWVEKRFAAVGVRLPSEVETVAEGVFR